MDSSQNPDTRQTKQYPRRQSHFAHKFCRLLAHVCAAQDIGKDACYLLTIIVHCEDAKKYRDGVTYWNEQLQAIGAFSPAGLWRARDKAAKAGWLYYEQGAKGRAAKYWVEIPKQFKDMPDVELGADVPLHSEEEIGGELASEAKIPLHIEEECGRKAGGKREECGRKAGGKREECEEHSYPNPNPNPDPDPKEKATDEPPPGQPGKPADSFPKRLQELIEFWNGMKAEGIVAAAVRPEWTKKMRQCWNRHQREPEVKELLKDLDRIRDALRSSPFQREKMFFKFVHLMGRRNGDGEMVLQELLNGGYGNARNGKHNGRTHSGSAKFDESTIGADTGFD